ncbi:recombination directionality factor [Streptomyces nigrescens]
MALDIWKTDPDNKPEPRKTYSDDTVGRLHSGYMEKATDDKKAYPVALSEWRFSTGEKVVADAVAELFGGTPVEDEESTSENFIDVFTEQGRLQIVIEADGIYSDMKQWSNGKLVHHCTGTTFLSHPFDESKIGQPCGCPTLFAERKEAAKNNMGPNPAITVTFRLAQDTELGKFKWQTGSWTLAAVLHEAEDALERIGNGGPVLAEVELEEVSYVAKKGKMKGKTVEYTKPVLTVRKSFNDAIAD